MESHLCWEYSKGENYSPVLRREYTTNILELRVGFRALANFLFSAVIKFPFFQRYWSWATAFQSLKDKG